MVEQNDKGKTVECPWCAKETAIIIKNPPVTDVPAPAPRPVIKQAARMITPAILAREHLNTIRANSCYTALRSALGLVFGCVYVLLGIALVASITSVFVNGTAILAAAIVAVTVIIFAALFAVAGHQASLLLVDIADTLVHHGMKR